MHYQLLNLPYIKSLGVSTKDWNLFQLSSFALVPLTQRDRKKAISLLKKPWIKENQTWKRELLRMLFLNCKIEIQGITMFDPCYLVDKYIPYKLNHSSYWM